MAETYKLSQWCNDVAVYIYTCMNKERQWRYTYKGEKFGKKDRQISPVQ